MQKLFNTLIVVVLALFFTNCDSFDGFEHLNYKSGSMSAIKNGEPWEASTLTPIQKDKNDSILVRGSKYNEQGYLREVLSIKNFKIGVNKTILLSNKSENTDTKLNAKFYKLTADGDVLDGSYSMSDTDSSYFEFFIEGRNRKIVGNFHIVFVRDIKESIINPIVPDTICFRSGILNSPLFKD